METRLILLLFSWSIVFLIYLQDAQEKHITRHSVKKVKSKSFHENSEDVLDGTSNPGHNFGAKQPISLSIASAVELLKVVFLNSSMAPVVPDLLRMTLIEYPENDLLAAFEYLRKKNFLVTCLTWFMWLTFLSLASSSLVSVTFIFSSRKGLYI